MEIKRGDIWYVSKDNYTGCEQAAGPPAIIVSNKKNNACAEMVEVVYLTTQPKKTCRRTFSSAVRNVKALPSVSRLRPYRLTDCWATRAT